VVGETFLRDLRIRVFDHLQRLAMPFYDLKKAGVLVSRMTSDIDSLQEFVQMGLLTLISNTLLLLLSVGVLSVISVRLMLVCAVVVPFVVVATRWFQRESRRAYLEVRDRIGHTLSLLQEGIAGVRVIQAFDREQFEVERFASAGRYTARTWSRSGSRPGTCRSSSSQGWERPPRCSRQAGGWSPEDS
jgi:ATP-binding cassette subfamily B protein